MICFLMFKQQEFRNAAKCLPHYFMEPGLSITPLMSRHHEVGSFDIYCTQSGLDPSPSGSREMAERLHMKRNKVLSCMHLSFLWRFRELLCHCEWNMKGKGTLGGTAFRGEIHLLIRGLYFAWNCFISRHRGSDLSYLTCGHLNNSLGFSP